MKPPSSVKVSPPRSVQLRPPGRLIEFQHLNLVAGFAQFQRRRHAGKTGAEDQDRCALTSPPSSIGPCRRNPTQSRGWSWPDTSPRCRRACRSTPRDRAELSRCRPASPLYPRIGPPEYMGPHCGDAYAPLSSPFRSTRGACPLRKPPLDCFADARNDAAQILSRRDPRPSFANHNAKIDSPPARMIPKSGVRFSDKIMRGEEGGGAPKGASNQFRAAPANVAAYRCPGAEARHADKCTQSAHLSACGARSPSGATPRLSPGLSHSGSAPGHACRDRSGQAFYPPFPVPSPVEAPHASAVVPKGMMPKAAPAQVASLHGSTALAPHFRSHPECVPR